MNRIVIFTLLLVLNQMTHAQIDLNKKINNKLNKAVGKNNDDGITTNIHKHNVGKVVFSDVLIARTDDNEGVLKSSFPSLNGPIYGRLFMKQSIANAYEESGKAYNGKASYNTEILIDGTKMGNTFTTLNAEDGQKLTNWLVVISSEDKYDRSENRDLLTKLAYILSTVAPGQHEIKLRMLAYGQNDTEILLGEGGFTVNFTEKDRDQYVQTYGLRNGARGLLDSEKGLEAEVKVLCHKSVQVIRCPRNWEYRYNADNEITHRVTAVQTAYVDDQGRCRGGFFLIEQTKFADHWSKAMVCNSEDINKWGSAEEELPCQNFELVAE